jgi:TRAP-type C4-dicarboxylate transport system permease small subunit
MRYLAQRVCVQGQCFDGPLVGMNTLGDVVNKLMSFLVPLASIVLFIVLIMGGYDFLMSQGNAEKIKSGRAKITAGIIGFILIALAFVITKLVAYILGLGEGIM